MCNLGGIILVIKYVANADMQTSGKGTRRMDAACAGPRRAIGLIIGEDVVVMKDPLDVVRLH